MLDKKFETWRVLLVDDDEDDYLLTRSMLKEAQGRRIELDWASSFQEGHERLDSNHYHAVLIDYDLGGGTGIELIRRTTAQGYPAPLILYTDRGSYEVYVEGMEAGATLYLTKKEATPLLLERFIQYAIEHKHMEAELDRRLQERSEILNSIQDGLIGINRDWTISYINRRAAQNGSLEPEELSGLNLWEAFPLLRGTFMEKNYRLVMEEHKPVQFEMHGVYQDKWYSISVYPSLDGITVFWQDITERKQAEEALRQSEERFAKAFRSSPIALSITRAADGRYIDVNESYLRIFGYSREEVIGHTSIELGVYSNPDERAELVRLLKEQGSIRNYEMTTSIRSGEIRKILLSAEQIEISGEPCIIATLRDITERKQAVKALRESEERFRAIADGTPVIIWVTDAAGQIEFINRAYSEFFGVTMEHSRSEGWQPLVHPEDKAGYVDVFMDCLRHRRTFQAECRVRHRDSEWRWIDSYGQPRFSPSGDFLGIAGSSIDITDCKRTEEALHAYTEQLKHSNQALEDFAFMASHDLREPLRKVQAFSDRLVKQAGDRLDEQEQDYLERMDQAAERMQNMLDGLLAYSRVTTQERPLEVCDLNQVAAEVITDLEVRLAETGGKVELGELSLIQADPVQMRQLLQNLIGNALKFHKPGVPPSVKVLCKSVPNDCVELVVEDNGIGFDMSSAGQLFKPFHRLVGKSEYEGTGMGLAICQKIAERHRGSITAKSEPEVGSTFTVTLPRMPDP